MSNKSDNQQDLNEILNRSFKLNALEMKFSEGDKDGPKSQVLAKIKKAEEAILPLRLQFNDFTQIMSNLDDEKMSSISNEEKFQMIRSKVIGITERLQSLSSEFEELQPLFATVNEYSEKYKNKNFQVIQLLNGYNHIGKTGSITGGTPGAASSTPTNLNQTGSSISANTKKVTKNIPTPGPSVTTPSNSTNIATPGSATTPATQAKKPRKARQTKKQQQAAAAAAAAATAAVAQTQTQGHGNSQGRTPSIGMVSNAGTPIVANSNMKSGQTPVPPNTLNPIGMSGNIPMSNNIASPGNMHNKNKSNPNSMLSPLANSSQMNQMFNMHNQFPNQQQVGNKIGNAQFNEVNHMNNNNNNNDMGLGMGNSSMNLGMGMGMNMGMNMNQITPANILSMNNSKSLNDGLQQMNNGNIMMDQNNNGNNNNNSKSAYDLVDLNSLDLSSLNMDFL